MTVSITPGASLFQNCRENEAIGNATIYQLQAQISSTYRPNKEGIQFKSGIALTCMHAICYNYNVMYMYSPRIILIG